MKLTLESLPMYVEECGDCWLWTQGTNSSGLPQCRVGTGRSVMVKHHIFTELLAKRVPKKWVVASRCMEKMCVRPEHLQSISRSELMRRVYRLHKRVPALEYMARVRGCVSKKLTWDDARQIRGEYAAGGVTHKVLAERYGVDRSTIANVVNGKTWITPEVAHPMSLNSPIFRIAA